jgi:hypothetical protein
MAKQALSSIDRRPEFLGPGLTAAGTTRQVTIQSGRVEVDSRTGRVVIATTVLGSAVGLRRSDLVEVGS